MKTIWIINQYASTPDVGMGGRHYYLANELAKLGYRVYVIASASSHLLREQPTFPGAFHVVKVAERFSFLWVKLPKYERSSSKQRALNWFLFAWQLQNLTKVITEKPDVILHSSPSLVSFLGAQRLAKKFSARLVFEVRDIWPLTLVELGGYSSRHPFIQLMQWIERKAYRDSDRVVSNLRKSVQHMVHHGLDERKFSWIANGFSLDEVAQAAELDFSTLQEIPENKFIVGYTGTMGVANALDDLIDAAGKLTGFLDICFVLIGSGKERARLKKRVDQENLKNVVFIDPIPKTQVHKVLQFFDVCYIGWRSESLYRFGIAANKIPEYMYSGKPILHGYSGTCDPVSEFGCGVVVNAEDVQSLVEGVLKLYRLSSDERAIMGGNGCAAALEHYEYGGLASKLEKVLFDD